MLVTVNILFSFALEQNYLPAGQPTAATQLRKVKVPDSDIGIFTPDEFSQIIHAAPAHLIRLPEIREHRHRGEFKTASVTRVIVFHRNQ